MLVSVILPVYERAAVVGDAVESVRDQTHEELELIVVDGGSSDGTVEVVYCGIENAEFGVATPDSEVRGDALDRALEMNTLPCIPSTMLIERSTLKEIMPLSHRRDADDIGMKIELARRTRFEYVDAPLVERGRAENPLSRSWDHVEARKFLLRAYRDLYEQVPDEIHREAAKQTYYREGNEYLEERVWTPAAVAAFARAAYYAPEDRAVPVPGRRRPPVSPRRWRCAPRRSRGAYPLVTSQLRGRRTGSRPRTRSAERRQHLPTKSTGKIGPGRQTSDATRLRRSRSKSRLTKSQ